eukprot:TRINITY_DN1311_c0_g2_i3.p1 TRINITY_DN1311_c0_g2~~TRINITY_DN1311_c0_g2_i3.p1  ORF type:complete len:127 (+),score=2.31 TRINITY_DN1311_c0_g2_i3:204-584(+)
MFKVYPGLLGAVLLATLLCLGPCTRADIIQYEEKILGPELLFKVTVGRGMYAPQDAPAKTAPGNGRTFVHVHMQFERHVDSPADPSMSLSLSLCVCVCVCLSLSLSTYPIPHLPPTLPVYQPWRPL